jgi:glycosyltransferase involved in cell wall biosynthesis
MSGVVTGGPALSLVMPCYNEEAIVGQTVRRILIAFERAAIPVEVVAVDNGSTDRTGEILEGLSRRYPSVKPVRVQTNIGYGFGVLTGLAACQAPWVGAVAADGQVDAEDVVRLYEGAVAAGVPVLAKARRRFRLDGPIRKVVSIAYNLLFRLFWPRVGSLDINGLPKILPRDAVQVMELTSRGWCLDPEIMLKAYYLGLPILEYNVFARMRGSGLSHVRASTCSEFLWWMLQYRFSGDLKAWRRRALAPLSGSPRVGHELV